MKSVDQWIRQHSGSARLLVHAGIQLKELVAPEKNPFHTVSVHSQQCVRLVGRYCSRLQETIISLRILIYKQLSIQMPTTRQRYEQLKDCFTNIWKSSLCLGSRLKSLLDLTEVVLALRMCRRSFINRGGSQHQAVGLHQVLQLRSCMRQLTVCERVQRHCYDIETMALYVHYINEILIIASNEEELLRHFDQLNSSCNMIQPFVSESFAVAFSRLVECSALRILVTCKHSRTFKSISTSNRLI